MRKFLLPILLITSLFARETVAFIGFNSEGLSSDDRKLLESRIITEIKNNKIFEIVEFSESDIIIDNNEKLLECSDIDCAVDIGNILNVKYVIIGTFGKIQDNYFISLKMTNTNNVIDNYQVFYDTKNFKKLTDEGMANLALQLKKVPIGKKETEKSSSWNIDVGINGGFQGLGTNVSKATINGVTKDAIKNKNEEGGYISNLYIKTYNNEKFAYGIGLNRDAIIYKKDYQSYSSIHYKYYLSFDIKPHHNFPIFIELRLGRCKGTNYTMGGAISKDGETYFGDLKDPENGFYYGISTKIFINQNHYLQFIYSKRNNSYSDNIETIDGDIPFSKEITRSSLGITYGYQLDLSENYFIK